MPVLELLLRQLKQSGVDEVILAVNHLHHLIRAFCGDGSNLGLKISYVLEDKPLGTAGPMAAVLDELGDDFIVTNGDLLTNFNIPEMASRHEATGAAASIAVFERKLNIDFGLVEVDETMRLVGYREKPSFSHLVSMGLYILNRAAVTPHLKPGIHLDMPQLMLLLKEDGKQVQCNNQDCVWLDIGRPDDYSAAQDLFEKSREIFLKE
jgi:NDP-sugar pyrophosphorylase family protein